MVAKLTSAFAMLTFACHAPRAVKGFLCNRQQPLSLVRTVSLQVSESSLVDERTFNGHVVVLEKSDHYLVVSKPPAVVCHHSEFTGSRAQMEIPMLQRVRQAIDRKVNLVHRLDRGCSGALLLTYTNDSLTDTNDKGPTALLSDAMKDLDSQKTYLALVRGEGILHGRDFKQEGWFKVDRPIKNEKGILNNATTWFRFVAGQDNDQGRIDRPRASLVLCRPETGRWHQIRRHLNGLSHPILGDSSHGNSKVNREWRKLGMLSERTCLHLVRLQLGPSPAAREGINVTCPLELDMMDMLEKHLPEVLSNALPILQQEGINLQSTSSNHEDPRRIPFAMKI